MQHLDENDQLDAPSKRRITLRRALVIVAILLLLVLMAVLPPLVNVSRYQKRIASSIGESIGRTVTIDSVTLTMLPWPGFEITNLVVGEDPAFGYEPVIRANTVRARLRISSLWRRRIEFSKITFDEPTSVNLVHLPDGRWNVESILLQAARMPAAPTAQRAAGAAPRFPYIEATGARLNLKQGFEKLPFSLTDADFALWLPQPDTWQLRLEAHPARTDTAVSDTGTMRLEGTFGRAASLAAAPIDLKGEWRAAPLGAASQILLGKDAGLRGDLNLTVGINGTAGQNALRTRLQLKNTRRADFVPEHLLDIDVTCTARSTAMFHRFDDATCNWPAGDNKGLTVTGSIPDNLHLASAKGTLQVADVPATALLDGIHVASGRVPAGLKLGGTVHGQMDWPIAPEPSTPDANTFRIQKARLSFGDGAPFVDQSADAPVVLTVQPDGLHLAPVPLLLEEKDPTATIEGTFRRDGYTIRLTGSAFRSRVVNLGQIIPQFGDGLAAVLPPVDTTATTQPPIPPEIPLHLDIVANRTWGSEQIWSQAAPAPRETTRKKHR